MENMVTPGLAQKMLKEGCIKCDASVTKGLVPATVQCTGCRKVFTVETPKGKDNALYRIFKENTPEMPEGDWEDALMFLVERALHFCHREEISFDFCLSKAKESFELAVRKEEETAAQLRKEADARKLIEELSGQELISLIETAASTVRNENGLPTMPLPTKLYEKIENANL